jgi:hypothetical protein
VVRQKGRHLCLQSQGGRSVGWIIAATSFAFAVIQLDVTIVNVALPQCGFGSKLGRAAMGRRCLYPWFRSLADFRWSG